MRLVAVCGLRPDTSNIDNTDVNDTDIEDATSTTQGVHQGLPVLCHPGCCKDNKSQRNRYSTMPTCNVLIPSESATALSPYRSW